MRLNNPGYKRSHRISDFGFRSSDFGFTLIELLVVLAIIGIVLALSVPHFRHLNEGRVMEGAARQLLDDLSFARQNAIAHRGTVAMVFVPPNVAAMEPKYTGDDLEKIKQLEGGPFTMYSIVALRHAGDQPGAPTIRYLTPWRSLPEKVFIAESTFTNLPPSQFPFPQSSSIFTNLPYIAFDHEGRCVELNRVTGYLGVSQLAPNDLDVRLATGAILYVRNTNDNTVIGFTVQEVPPFNSISNANSIHVDKLTGRAKYEHPDVLARR